MKPLIPYTKEPIDFWRPIPGHPNYEASVEGKIRHLFEKGYIICTPYRKKNRPHSSIFYFRMDGKECSYHRAVYTAFYGMIPEGKKVFHRNGITSDHAPHNLELADDSIVGKRFARRARSRSVVQYDPETMEITAVYRSAREACEKNHFCKQVISDRCNGKVKYASSLDGMEYCWEDDEKSYRMMLERIKKGKRSRECKPKKGRPKKR